MWVSKDLYVSSSKGGTKIEGLSRLLLTEPFDDARNVKKSIEAACHVRIK